MAPQTSLAGLIADRLHRPRAEIASLERAIFSRGYDASGPSTRAATLVLLALSGATPDTALATYAALQRLKDRDGTLAVPFVAMLIEHLRDYAGAGDLLSTWAYRSTIAVELGDDADDLAVTIKAATDDAPAEPLTFTVDGTPHRPDQNEAVGASLYVGGRLLFQLAADLWDFERGLA